MNTKPQKKRYSKDKRSSNAAIPKGVWQSGLLNPEFASRFGRLVSEYSYLEDKMAPILAILLGMSDTELTGYVLRAIISPSVRIDMMNDLLTLAPQNAHRGEEYDEIIREFASIGKRRNAYVHGKWWTCQDDGRVCIAEYPEHEYSFLEMREATLAELNDVIGRIATLNLEIERAVDIENETRQQAGLPQLQRGPGIFERIPRRKGG